MAALPILCKCCTYVLKDLKSFQILFAFCSLLGYKFYTVVLRDCRACGEWVFHLWYATNYMGLSYQSMWYITLMHLQLNTGLVWNWDPTCISLQIGQIIVCTFGLQNVFVVYIFLRKLVQRRHFACSLKKRTWVTARSFPE